jgi:hypothetical protein
MLTQNPRAVIDCGEFQHSVEIANLIGSPPGYFDLDAAKGEAMLPGRTHYVRRTFQK